LFSFSTREGTGGIGGGKTEAVKTSILELEEGSVMIFKTGLPALAVAGIEADVRREAVKAPPVKKEGAVI
jgi:hypothetical protein